MLQVASQRSLARPVHLLCVSIALLSIGAACESKLRSVNPAREDAAPPPPSLPSDGGAGISLPDGSDATLSPRPPGAGEQCAEEVFTGELVPLDLMLVLDASGSMRVSIGGKTRWQQVSDALSTFVRDARSTGLGVGLQTFPFTIFGKPCKTDADCGGVGGPGEGYWCTQPFHCLGAGVDIATARTCDPNDAFCPMGTRCQAAGRCATSGARCANLGGTCAGGDACGPAPTVCKMQIDSCEPADYASPRVAIGPLPGAVAPLAAGLAAVNPGGNTPISPALTGAAEHLRTYLAGHAGHRGALVLATDVSPSGCAGDTIAGVAGVITAARMASPPIATYVIAALSAGDNLRAMDAATLAQAGGTGAPVVLDGSAADLGSKFLDALTAIRGSALACELRIPKPAAGNIDYGKVNVRHVTAAGTEDLVYVGSEAGCTGGGAGAGGGALEKSGWFYDVPPGQGTPSTVRVCPTTCAAFKGAPGGVVQLRFGCTTRVE